MKLTNRNSGFTMLELLAVLAIVLILGAILFPAIESAREKSLTTACSQNVKQLVLAITQYEQDKNQFPPGRQFLNASGAAANATDMILWGNAIAPYMHADPNAVTSMKNVSSIVAAPQLTALPPGNAGDLYPDAYRCPSVSNWDKMGYNMTYGYNYQYLGNADPKTVVTATAANRGYVNFPVTKGSIQRPDKTICVADSDGTGTAGYVSAANAANTQPDEGRLGAFAYLLDPTFLPVRDLDGQTVPLAPVAPGAAGATMGPTAGGLMPIAGVISINPGISVTAPGGPINQGFRSVVSNRHKGSANIGFLDGHVEVRIREEVYFATANLNNNPLAAAGITANAGNRLFLSNALWNGVGVDNDSDGNGLVEPAAGERILDPNEAYLNLATAPLMGAAYNPQAPGAGYDGITALGGAYTTYGPGFDTSLAGFIQAATGPTLPHLPPFNLNANAAAEQ